MMKRAETGPMIFGCDWAGVFIRGDNALYYATQIREIQELFKEQLSQDLCLQFALENLKSILMSCDQYSSATKQNMKPFEDCIDNNKQ